MRIDELEPGQLLATPKGELLRVHSVQYKRLKAQVLFPLQKQPTFREYGQDLVAIMRDPSAALMAKYQDAVDTRRRKR